MKLIIRGGVGMDNIDKEYASSKGIVATNTPNASNIAVAELTFALMLAVPNKLITAHNGMKEGKWLKSEIKRTELFGKTLCLVGLGHIAQEVAKRAKAFGMKVVAYEITGKGGEFAELKGSLKEAFEAADYISIHVPLNDGTKNMINKESISWMKDGAVLINTARGKCVVESDLAEALETGKDSAYATDVWYSDPPPADSPILKAPNVIMTPHLGANSKENLLRIGDEVVATIDAFIKGGK